MKENIEEKMNTLEERVKRLEGLKTTFIIIIPRYKYSEDKIKELFSNFNIRRNPEQFILSDDVQYEEEYLIDLYTLENLATLQRLLNIESKLIIDYTENFPIIFAQDDFE